MAIPAVEQEMYKWAWTLAIADNEEAIQDYWSIELPYGPAIYSWVYNQEKAKHMFTQKVIHKYKCS